MTSYCGAPPDPVELMSRWNLDPALLVALGAGALLARRSQRPNLVLAAIGVLALAFVSPLCALSVSLFSVRTVHHLLIVTAAAPLLAMAFPARLAVLPGVAFAVATATLWAWHLPSLYDAALAHTVIYWLMQATLLASAFWFWQAMFAAPPVTGALFATLGMAQMGMLGALLTFATTPLYATHVATTLPWGLEQVADQQIAGLIMWVPGIIPYALAVAVIARRAWVKAATAA
ncbi:cytochrome c oxidase assembly protein [Roseomonas sp. 1311]|uniref:Cytochrome c oxidase assembly protein n=2 Tax=Roseomonas marmotae TaxID=2768161 RepID=A0ABS3KI55_9PROT|nr:cytochrome c oxidase assembly protein [Roseomonas marmotae]